NLEASMFCRTCGKEIGNESVFCRYCGSRTMFPQPAFPNSQLEIVQEKDDDKINVGLIFVCFLIFIVGIVLGASNLKDGRKKSGKVYLVVGIVSAVIDITFSIIYLMFLCDFFSLLSNALFHTSY
ncbi:MAG: zinc-ribbon domain-containing protein, partial [Oscillospiraceae bacterium]